MDIIRFFLENKQKGKTIARYGAPAKGNTLLNYCGIGKDFISYTVDRKMIISRDCIYRGREYRSGILKKLG